MAQACGVHYVCVGSRPNSDGVALWRRVDTTGSWETPAGPDRVCRDDVLAERPAHRTPALDCACGAPAFKIIILPRMPAFNPFDADAVCCLMLL